MGAVGAAVLSNAGDQVVRALLPPKIGAGLGSAICGPLVEECAKGVALVAAFVLSHWAFERFGFLEFEGVTDGIVYGAAVGLGFAFSEDLLYLWNYTSALGPETGLKEYLRRVDFFGVGQLHHPVYTGALGVELGLATWSRSWRGRVGFPVLGLAAAILMHAVHNGLVNLVLVLRYGLEATAACRLVKLLPCPPMPVRPPIGVQQMLELLRYVHGILLPSATPFNEWYAGPNQL